MERVPAFKKVLKFELCPPQKSVWCFNLDLGVVWWAVPHRGASAAAAGQHCCSLKGLGCFRKQVLRFKSLCVPKGGNQTSWGCVLEAAFRIVPVNSSMFAAFCYPSKACKEKKVIKILHRALSCLGTELPSTLLTGKCQRQKPPVFLELRSGITPATVGVP